MSIRSTFKYISVILTMIFILKLEASGSSARDLRFRETIKVQKFNQNNTELKSKWGLATGEIKERTIHQCLGREEEIIHELDLRGAITRFNRKMVNKLNGFSIAEVKPRFLNKICQYGRYSPSVNLLKYLLINRDEIFSVEGETEVMTSMKTVAATQLVEEAPDLFKQLLYFVRQDITQFACIETLIPEIDEYLDQSGAVEAESKKISRPYLYDKAKIEAIFLKLENFPELRKNCETFELKKEEPQKP